MDKQLELEQEAKYIRLIGGKVVYITEFEAMAEEVVTVPGDTEWDSLVKEANLIRERAGYLHQAMRDDDKRPSEYECDYQMLWWLYSAAICHLRQINNEVVDQFKEKVIVRIKELEIRLDAMCDAWDSDGFEDFERLLALYEKLYDQAVALAR
ncbi:unnamed protein product [marine sediment metagenome]|uniref:Uncharacterized protein n=1 Tax=marine sediment metagenome TaxID=412755 RepID=X1SEK1_9ZZZZ